MLHETNPTDQSYACFWLIVIGCLSLVIAGVGCYATKIVSQKLDELISFNTWFKSRSL